MRKFDKLTISFIALVVAFVLLVIYLLTAILKLPLTGRPDEITVHMNTTGGLFKGSAVNYRGVRVGTITDIVVGEQGPDATLTLKNGAEVPKDVTAEVKSLTPVGEQFLDLSPTGKGSGNLEDGDEIDADVVDLPITVASAADNLDGLLDEIDDKNIVILMSELGAAVDDSSGDLETLLDSSKALIDSLNKAWPSTDTLLTDGLTVNQLLARHRDDLVTFSKSAKSLTAWLVKFDPTFQRILKDAPADLEAVQLLIKDLGPVLPALLSNLETTTNLLADRDASVRALTWTTPWGVNRVNSTMRGGWWYLRAFVDGEPLCTYGTPEDPKRGTDTTFDRNGHCTGDPQRWRAEPHSLPPVNR